MCCLCLCVSCVPVAACVSVCVCVWSAIFIPLCVVHREHRNFSSRCSVSSSPSIQHGYRLCCDISSLSSCFVARVLLMGFAPQRNLLSVIAIVFLPVVGSLMVICLAFCFYPPPCVLSAANESFQQRHLLGGRGRSPDPLGLLGARE